MRDEENYPALEAIALTKRFKHRTALDDCDLAIPRGAVVGLVGPNGAGKSTLLQSACGLSRPTSGMIRVLGRAPGTRPDHMAKIGFVAQDTPTYAGFSVEDHLTMGRHLNANWDDQLARARIRDVGLDLRQRAGRLSGGQRAQLALAVAAAKRPELLILDEPAAALDPIARQSFMSNLMSFVTDLGATAVLSSHLMEDVERTCDYLVVLCGGRVQVAGPVIELLAEHRHVEVSANAIDAVVAAADVVALETIDGTARGTVRLTDRRLPDSVRLTPVPVRDLALAYMTRATRPSGASLPIEEGF